AIACPANITELATSSAGAIVNYTAPTATDNCSATPQQTAGLASGATFPIGQTTNTFSATDPAGNTSTCSFTVTVSGVAPSITCPSDIAVNAATGQCSAVVTFAATETTGIPASTISYSVASGSTFNVGTTTVTATATNAVGTDQCSFTVTVSDAEAPVALCQDLTVQLDANGQASLSANDVDTGSSDNCGIGSLALNQTAFGCGDLGTNQVTLTVTDVNGHTSICTAQVTVADATAPTLTCPTNITVVATSDAGAVVSYATPVYTDNCSATLQQTAGLASGATFPLGTTTNTFEATDPSGNTTSCSSTVTVEGVPPAIVCPADISVGTDLGQCSAAVTYAATETTGIPASTITYDIAPGSTFSVGTVTVTATATNSAGTDQCSFTVTVSDDEAPVALCQDLTVQLDANGQASLSANDVDAGSSDNCGISSMSLDQTSFDCDDVGGGNAWALEFDGVNDYVTVPNGTANMVG
ncbi:MAG: HYR domain-containing protein, partial [Bacteroidetes bacterium]